MIVDVIVWLILLIVITLSVLIGLWVLFDIFGNDCDGIKEIWDDFSSFLEFIVDSIFDYFSDRKQAKLDAARKHKRKVKDLYYSFLGYKVK